MIELELREGLENSFEDLDFLNCVVRDIEVQIQGKRNRVRRMGRELLATKILSRIPDNNNNLSSDHFRQIEDDMDQNLTDFWVSCPEMKRSIDFDAFKEAVREKFSAFVSEISIAVSPMSSEI